MTAQQELDEFDKTNPWVCSRRTALRLAYDQLCSHKSFCSSGGLPTSESIDKAAKAIGEELDQLEPLVFRRRVLADAAFREALGLQPRE